ncbi:MAG: ABC transporter permease, partial [Promethearchaeota archaeon]
MGNMKKFYYHFGLMIHFSHVNLRLTMFTLVGLTIGLSMVSTALIQLDSTKTEFYFNTLKNYQDLDNFKVITGDIPATRLDSIAEIETLIDSKIRENNLTDIIHIRDYYPYASLSNPSFLGSRRDPFGFFNQTSLAGYTTIYGISGFNESILENCILNSHLPGVPNEVLVFIRNTTTYPLNLNEQFNISLLINPTLSHNFTFTAVGLLTPSTIKDDLISSLFNLSNSEYGLLTSLNITLHLTQNMSKAIKDLYNQDMSFSANVHFSYTFEFSLITREHVFELKDAIFNLNNDLLDLESSSEFYIEWLAFLSYSIYGEYRAGIQQEFSEFEGLYLSFIYLSIPVLILVILLVRFSLSLINENRSRALRLLKLRGVSNRFVFLILFVEAVILVFVGSFISLFVGVPVSLLLGSSTGLLTFNQPINPSKFIITPNTLFSVFMMGGILAFLFYFPSIIKLSQSTILSLYMDTQQQRQGRIRVILGKLDVPFLILGSSGIIITFTLFDMINSNPSSQEIFAVLLPFLSFLVTVSPLLFLIGSLSTCNRFIPVLVHTIGKYFWNRDWRLLAVATRNLELNSHVTRRTTLLIATTLSLLIVFSILSASFQHQRVDNVFYQVGSDLSITTGSTPALSNEFNRLLSDLRNISGLTFTTIKEDQSANIRIMGIDEGFTQVAHWQKYYATQPLEILVELLLNSTSEIPVIIDSQTMQREQLSIGSSYITNWYDNKLNFTVVAVTHYWPRLIIQGQESFFITKTSLIDNITGPRSNSNTLLAKIQPGYDKNVVISTVKEMTTSRRSHTYLPVIFMLKIAYEYDALREDSVQTMFLWLIVNINLLTQL